MRCSILACALLVFAAPAGARLPLEKIRLPAGFSISVYAEDVPGARSLALGKNGTVFVGSRRAGKLYALGDKDGDGRAETVRVLAKGLNSPNGVAVRGNDLYAAEIGRILIFKDIEARLEENAPAYAVLADDLPKNRHHGWKFIRFGQDGMLYVPVGAPCNVCLREDDPRYASILRMDPDTGKAEVFASGVRNTVGFDWRPETGVLWFTDNGRDWLGEDAPPDELNRAPEAGLHFGFPFCHGGDIPDPKFDSRPCSDFVPPVRRLAAHAAAVGMRFYEGKMFPKEYRGDVLIAEHGSWNRSTPIGYRVTRVKIRGDKAAGYETFAEGWRSDGRVWGRPVDLLLLPDGSLLISDDEAGAVYRVSYRDALP